MRTFFGELRGDLFSAALPWSTAGAEGAATDVLTAPKPSRFSLLASRPSSPSIPCGSRISVLSFNDVAGSRRTWHSHYRPRTRVDVQDADRPNILLHAQPQN